MHEVSEVVCGKDGSRQRYLNVHAVDGRLGGLRIYRANPKALLNKWVAREAVVVMSPYIGTDLTYISARCWMTRGVQPIQSLATGWSVSQRQASEECRKTENSETNDVPCR